MRRRRKIRRAAATETQSLAVSSAIAGHGRGEYGGRAEYENARRAWWECLEAGRLLEVCSSACAGDTSKRIRNFIAASHSLWSRGT